MRSWWAFGLGACLLHSGLCATPLPTVEVLGQVQADLGSSEAASEGVVDGSTLQSRPRLRAGDVVEAVPGVAATQHSGDGKANQYFLRGFNLDHGTDLALTVDGMPVNMPTHAHGQGFADLNFLVPELVSQLRYRKGPYAADAGDFSLAGSIDLNYRAHLPGALAELTLGPDRYQRALLAGSRSEADQHWLAALELQGDDGPWVVAEGLRKFNAVLRYTQGTAAQGWHLSAMAYDSRWTATDQVPQRAVQTGEVTRFGSMDPSDGGQSRRLSLSGQWHANDSHGATQISAYAIDSQLQLWSNFTYFLNNPAQGDQFEQADSRRVYGARVDHQVAHPLAGRDGVLSIGASWRGDRISQLGLYATQSRVRLSTVRDDAVDQDLVALYAQQMLNFSDRWRGYAGLRNDGLSYRVQGQDPVYGALNSGQGQTGLISPKAGLAWALHPAHELYVNTGSGFHSNDVRGATIQVEPASGQPAAGSGPMVRGWGSELGWRYVPDPQLSVTLALWQLHLDSELVFQGDTGSTTPTRASRRHGLEGSLRWQFTSQWLLDLDAAVSQARYVGEAAAGEGNAVPNALSSVLAAGLTWQHGPWRSSLRWRYLGERALDSTDTARAPAVNLLNLGLRYAPSARWSGGVDVFNLTDVQANDIAYLYASCTARELGAGSCGASMSGLSGVSGLHAHPMAPRTVRLSLRLQF